MAKDKLITVRIEGEKREAFNNLAKSQNTDTASLLYDFISGCLDGKIDIGIVTGKKQWIDKIDNQLDSKRIDKLETATQEIDNRLGTIAKKLNDWIEAIDDRLNDCCERHSSIWISTLSSQLDSQKLDRIDTDSQEIDTGETHDIETVVKVGAVEPISLIDEPGTDAIGTLPTVETDSSIGTVASAIETDDREWLTLKQIADKKIKGLPGTHQGLRPYAENWEWRENPTKKGKQYKIPKEYL